MEAIAKENICLWFHHLQYHNCKQIMFLNTLEGHEAFRVRRNFIFSIVIHFCVFCVARTLTQYINQYINGDDHDRDLLLLVLRVNAE